ncbi:hypothetical protein DPMN_158169 [Dreissena polymorpha]|uniref:Uncharacterized protein n=1 Tax=Dreissena polymorpha TaxID=45954 RepID=A0A9D4EKV7_DREPO|nr:hypothetical protein DPMN_158169 [Dreissena polymorpha]
MLIVNTHHVFSEILALYYGDRDRFRFRPSAEKLICAQFTSVIICQFEPLSLYHEYADISVGGYALFVNISTTDLSSVLEMSMTGGKNGDGFGAPEL